MKRTKPTTLPIGVISEGTLRPEDLIPAYLDALEGLRLSKIDRWALNKDRRMFESLPNGERWNGHDEPVIDWTDEQHDLAANILEELTDLLDNHCPDYAYFGAHEGDGACFGVWPAMSSLEEDSMSPNSEVVKINAGDSFPELSGIGYVMSVTDHGNVTLYRRAGNRWIEVWSVV